MAQANGTSQISISYDKNTDTFFLYLIDGNRKSIAKDMGGGIIVQIDQNTKEPLGFVVHDFEARFSKSSERRASLRLPFPTLATHA